MKRLVIIFLILGTHVTSFTQKLPEQYREKFSESYPICKEQHLEIKAYVDRLLNGEIEKSMNFFQPNFFSADDHLNISYIEPIVNLYKKIYGIDIFKYKADPLKIIKIRGKFLIDFLEKVVDIIHASGKKLQVHLRYCYEDPKLSDDFNELVFWAMPKILPDWKKVVDLADEITLKHYYFNNYQPDLAGKIKTYIKSQGKKVWVHCYISQGKELNESFFNKVEADDKVKGILLYEVDNLLETYGLSGGYKEQIVGKLRSIMEHLEYK